jgi:hypothetical protein
MSDETAEEIRQLYRKAVIRLHVEAEARTFGMIDPDDAASFADLSKCSYDEDSNVVVGAREAILDLAARKPYLFSRPYERHVPPPPGTKPRLRG